MAFAGIEAPLPLAQFGLNGSKNVKALPYGALIDTEAITLDQTTIGREGGSVVYNATPLSGAPKVRALLDWWPTPTVQRLLAVSADGKVTRFTTGTADATMKTGLSAAMLPVFALGGQESFGRTRKAFLTTGVDVVQVVDGDAAVTRDLGVNLPADWSGTNQPRFLAPHGQRLWGGFQTRIYGSAKTDHEDFRAASGGQQLPVYSGTYDFLQGGVSFKQLFFLWGWPRGIFVLDDSAVTPADWRVDRLTDGIGLAGPNAFAVVDNDVLFLSEVGHLHLLSYVRNFDILASDLMLANELTQWVQDNVELDASALQYAQVRYSPLRKVALVALRGKGASTNTLRLLVDFNREVPRIHTSTKDICEALEMWRDAKGMLRPISGDDAGTIWKQDQPGKDKAGAAYPSRFQTAHTDFGWLDPRLANRRKNLAWMELVVVPTGSFDLQVDTVIDGNYKATTTFSMGVQGAGLGSFILGTTALGGDFVQNTRRRLRGSGRYFSWVGRMALADGDFNVASMAVGFTAGGLKP